MHVVAPSAEIWPAMQSAQSVSWSEPVARTYLPAPHSLQSVSVFEAVDSRYLPPSQ